MDEKDRTVTVKEATEQVQLMARRMALMYHHIGEVLVERFGKDKAKEIMKEAIWRYGTECGESVKAGVTGMGLPLTPENFNRVPDLPVYGWDRELIFEEGEPRPKVNYCPLADVWLSKGSQEMGRVYCYVDQSKFQGYNPEIECVHTKNALDGDPFCVLSIHYKKPVQQSVTRPAPQSIKARVFRFDPGAGEGGRFQEYDIATDAPVSVMALMAKIHEQDPSFACRTSMCFHGTCGSCWVRVDGKNVKGCMQIVKPGQAVTIEPHPGYRVLRDVVVDFSSPMGEQIEEEVPGHEDR